MSWSFNAVGKSAAVLAKARADFERIKCVEPEESIKTKVLHQLEAALISMPSNVAVQVVAAGSQYAPDHSKPNEVINTLSLEIKPLYGFIE